MKDKMIRNISLIAMLLMVTACVASPVVVEKRKIGDDTLTCQQLMEEINTAKYYRQEAVESRAFSWKNALRAVLIFPYLISYGNTEDAIKAADDRKMEMVGLYNRKACSQQANNNGQMNFPPSGPVNGALGLSAGVAPQAAPQQAPQMMPQQQMQPPMMMQPQMQPMPPQQMQPTYQQPMMQQAPQQPMPPQMQPQMMVPQQMPQQQMMMQPQPLMQPMNYQVPYQQQMQTTTPMAAQIRTVTVGAPQQQGDYYPSEQQQQKMLVGYPEAQPAAPPPQAVLPPAVMPIQAGVPQYIPREQSPTQQQMKTGAQQADIWWPNTPPPQVLKGDNYYPEATKLRDAQHEKATFGWLPGYETVTGWMK